MTYDIPLSSFVDQTARDAAAAAQSTANTAQSTATTAQSTAESALSVATGKTTTYISATEPAAPAGGFTDGDQWIQTSDTGATLHTWDGTAWTATQWGSESLAADSVVAGTVAAGAVDGLTITGATVRTAASGKRVEVGSAVVDEVRFFTDDAGETPGGNGAIQVGVAIADTSGQGLTGPKDRAFMQMVPPQLGNTLRAPTAYLACFGPTRDGSDLGYSVINGVVLPRVSLQALYDDTGSTFRGRMLASGVWGYDFLDSTLRRPTVYLDLLGEVELSGVLGLDAAPTAGKLLATLTSQYRPSKTQTFVCFGGNNRPWRCDVHADGSVIFGASMASDWAFTAGTGTGASDLSLSGVRFPAASLF